LSSSGLKQKGCIRVWTGKKFQGTGGKAVTYSSFKLGLGERGFDLDLLAVVPRHVSREDFFADFYHHLAKKPEVSPRLLCQ